MPWEQIERIIDDSSTVEIGLPCSNLVPKADAERRRRWQDARRNALSAEVHVMAAECDEAANAIERSLESWKSVFAAERTVDLATLELLTIAAARIPAMATDGTRTIIVRVLEKLNKVWEELQYSADFKAVGMVYIAEGLMAAGERIRSVNLAKRASEKLADGQYPSFLARAKRLLEQ
jgi:hypothetical protein